MTIKFTLKSAVKKDGKRSLLMRVTHGRNYTKWVPTQLNIDPKYWDANQERVKKGHPAFSDLNRKIAKFKNKRETALSKFESDTMQLERIPKFLQGLADYKSLDEFVNDKIAEGSTDVSFNDYVTKLQTFKSHLDIKQPLEFKELNTALFKKFINICQIRGLQRKSVLSYLRAIIGICNMALDENIIFDEVKIPKSLKKSIKSPSRIRKSIRTVKTNEFLGAVSRVKTVQQWQSLSLWLLMFATRGLYPADLVKFTEEEFEEPNVVKELRNDLHILHLRSKSEQHENHTHMRIHIDSYTTLPLIKMIKKSIAYTTMRFHPEIIPPYKNSIQLYDYNPTDRSKFHKNLFATQQRRLREMGFARFKDARKTFSTEAKALSISEDVRLILLGRKNDPILDESYDNNEDVRISKQVQDAHREVLKAYRMQECVDALTVKLMSLNAPKCIIKSIEYNKGFVSVGHKNPEKKGFFATTVYPHDAYFEWEDVTKYSEGFQNYFKDGLTWSKKEEREHKAHYEQYKKEIDLWHLEQEEQRSKEKKRYSKINKLLEELSIESI